MAKFELNLDLKNFEKLTKIPQLIDAGLKKWETTSTELVKINNRTKELTDNLNKQGASMTRIWAVQKKASLERFFAMAKNPLGLVVLGTEKLFWGLTKITKIGLIAVFSFIAAALIKIGSLLFRFNVGGIATQFYRVYAVISQLINKAMLVFVGVAKKLGETLGPVIKDVADWIIKIVNNISSFFTKSAQGGKVFELIKNTFSVLGKIIGSVVNIVKQLFQGIGEGMGLAKDGGSGFLETIMTIVNWTYKLVQGLLWVIEKLKIFQIIGIAIGTVFKIIKGVIDIIVNTIQNIIDGIMIVKDLLTGDLGSAKERYNDMNQRNKDFVNGGTSNVVNNNNQTNANVTLNASNAVTPETAGFFGNQVVSSLSSASLRG